MLKSRHLHYVLFAALLLPAMPTIGQATKPNALELREWVVFVCDPAQEQANHGLFQSTVPPFVSGKRAAAPDEAMNDPSPVGVIRLLGEPDGGSIDVLLQVKRGQFLAGWPQAEK